MSTKNQIDFSALADQFRGLNPSDVATWPILPRLAALLGILVVTLVAGWWFIWNDQLASLTAKEQEEAKLKDEYLTKKKKAINLDLYVQQLNEIDQTFGALLKQLPNKSEMDALLIEINQAGLGRGLQFELFKPGAELTKDFYAELPIQVKLSGNYHEFGAFAADIAKLPRIVTLNNMAVSVGAGGRLGLDATVKTFRYLDQEELAKARAATKKASAKRGGQK
ncbi:MAG TPA: type 4a pilus biogenesis protein PilO [Rhodocyclaceae bacterium]|nr:type 4a pilus biogenesis protein PilO [Rhodocyclaceae bacterium]